MSKGWVCALSFYENNLLVGSRDSKIYLYDIRQKKYTKKYEQHRQEVCGIKFNNNGEYFASGGNDNKFFIYSLKMDMPLFKKVH